MEGLIARTIILIIVIYSSSAVARKENGDPGCPPRTYKFKNFCYAIEHVKAPYDLAEMMCERENGILAPIKDKETFYFIQKLRIRYYHKDYWFNFNDRHEWGKWVNDDNITSNFQKWSMHRPRNTSSNDQRCAKLRMIKGLKWGDANCLDKNYYICEYPDGSPCRAPSHKFSQHCYELSTEFATFDEALAKCQRKGGTLANDNSEAVHHFLKRLIHAERRWMDMSNAAVDKIIQNTTYRMQNDWFGLRNFEGEWKTSDGILLSRISFEKWISWSKVSTTKNLCASMNVEWFKNSCSAYKSFICRYEVSKDGTTQRKSGVGRNHAEECSGIRITSTKLGFALFGCIILGTILIVLLIIVGKLTRRIDVIIRTQDHNKEHRMSILDKEQM